MAGGGRERRNLGEEGAQPHSAAGLIPLEERIDFGARVGHVDLLICTRASEDCSSPRVCGRTRVYVSVCVCARARVSGCAHVYVRAVVLVLRLHRAGGIACEEDAVSWIETKKRIVVGAASSDGLKQLVEHLWHPIPATARTKWRGA
jgi:hypothetical protein